MCSSKVSFGFKLIAVLLVVVTLVTLIPKNLTAHVFAYDGDPYRPGCLCVFGLSHLSGVRLGCRRLSCGEFQGYEGPHEPNHVPLCTMIRLHAERISKDTAAIKQLL